MRPSRVPEKFCFWPAQPLLEIHETGHYSRIERIGIGEPRKNFNSDKFSAQVSAFPHFHHPQPPSPSIARVIVSPSPSLSSSPSYLPSLFIACVPAHTRRVCFVFAADRVHNEGAEHISAYESGLLIHHKARKGGRGRSWRPAQQQWVGMVRDVVEICGYLLVSVDALSENARVSGVDHASRT